MSHDQPGAPPPYGSQPPSYGNQPPGYGGPPPGYGGYPPGFGHPTPPVHGSATTSMVLGIVSLALILLAFLCGVTAPFAVIPGPIAIWLGVKARREIRASPQTYSGDGQALTGVITGIIGTVLGVIAIALVVVFFVIIGISINEATTY